MTARGVVRNADHDGDQALEEDPGQICVLTLTDSCELVMAHTHTHTHKRTGDPGQTNKTVKTESKTLAVDGVGVVVVDVVGQSSLAGAEEARDHDGRDGERRESAS